MGLVYNGIFSKTWLGVLRGPDTVEYFLKLGWRYMYCGAWIEWDISRHLPLRIKGLGYNGIYPDTWRGCRGAGIQWDISQNLAGNIAGPG